jgi:uncharacterized protein involved in exopolysaccharide biosynthesis
MRVADRLSAQFMDESARDRKLMLEGTDQFVDIRLAGLRERLDAAEQTLQQRRSGTERPSRAEMIEFETLQEMYRRLYAQKEEVSLMANLERREIGEQFKLIDAARLPVRPIGPPRWLIATGGALVGLVIGAALVLVVSARERRAARSPTT